jgi:hypothetical protein
MKWASDYNERVNSGYSFRSVSPTYSASLCVTSRLRRRSHEPLARPLRCQDISGKTDAVMSISRRPWRILAAFTLALACSCVGSEAAENARAIERGTAMTALVAKVGPPTVERPVKPESSGDACADDQGMFVRLNTMSISTV